MGASFSASLFVSVVCLAGSGSTSKTLEPPVQSADIVLSLSPSASLSCLLNVGGIIFLF